MKKVSKRPVIIACSILLILILIFAILFVSRINWAGRDYTYSPELPNPGVGIDFKYDDVLADLYIRWCNAYDNMLTSLWKAPKGVVKKPLRVTMRDGVTIGGYILEPEDGTGEKLPTMLFCHGGGFFLTMMNSQLDIGAIYADQLHCRVILPQYRTSLDHPYPTPVYDCYDVLRWIADSADADLDRIMIYGDSAGGCLAASVTQMCCDEKLLQPCCQMLIYPVTDTAQHYSSLTIYENATWTRESNIRMWKLYLSGYEPSEEDYAVPMLRENYDGIPKAYIEGAEMDTLYDQAMAYAEKMRAAGVDVTTETVEGAYHGYDGATQNPFVQKALQNRIDWLKAVLSGE